MGKEKDDRSPLERAQEALPNYCLIRLKWLAIDVFLENAAVVKKHLGLNYQHTVMQPNGKEVQVKMDGLIDKIDIKNFKSFNNWVQRELRMRSKCDALIEMNSINEGCYLEGNNALKRNSQNIFYFVRMVRNAIAHDNGAIDPERIKKEAHWKDLVVAPEMKQLYLGDVDLLMLLEDTIEILSEFIIKSGKSIDGKSIQLASDILQPKVLKGLYPSPQLAQKDAQL